MIAELAKRLHEDNPVSFSLTGAEALKLAGDLSGTVFDRTLRPSSTLEIYKSMRNGSCQLFGTPVVVRD